MKNSVVKINLFSYFLIKILNEGLNHVFFIFTIKSSFLNIGKIRESKKCFVKKKPINKVWVAGDALTHKWLRYKIKN